MFLAPAKAILLGVLFIAVFAVSATAQVELGTACEPYGSVTFNGQPAANNLLVIAYIGDVELARAYTSGGQYSLYIPRDAEDTPQRDGYRPGEIINIRVNGSPSTPAFEAFAGRQRRDLVVSAMAIRMETWGRIKALFK